MPSPIRSVFEFIGKFFAWMGIGYIIPDIIEFVQSFGPLNIPAEAIILLQVGTIALAIGNAAKIPISLKKQL